MNANGSAAPSPTDPLEKPPCIVPECPHAARSTVGLCVRCFNAARKGDKRIQQIVKEAQAAKQADLQRAGAPADAPPEPGDQAENGKESGMKETKTICNWPECNERPKSRGLCRKHYQLLFSTNAARRAEAERRAAPRANKGKKGAGQARPRRQKMKAKRRRAAPKTEPDAASDGKLAEMVEAFCEVAGRLGVAVAHWPFQGGERVVNLADGTELFIDPDGGIRPIELTIGKATEAGDDG